MVHPLHWAPAVMDYPHADRLGLVDAVDVLHRTRVPGQRSSFGVVVICTRAQSLTVDFVLPESVGRRPYLLVDRGFHVASCRCRHAR